ncbi:MAG: hypothetical protein KBS75_03320 [Bacteroidales bacterium]|nr:hypothetical protein [Candidatus Equimonas faecalis]
MKHSVLLASRFLLLALCLLLSTASRADSPLRIAVLGDSYSTFEGKMCPAINAVWYYPAESSHHNKANDVVSVEQTWWHQTVSRLGATLVQNNSYSGSTISFQGYVRRSPRQNDGQSFRAGQPADVSPSSFITRAACLGDSLGGPNLILVFGGTNDSWAGTPVGTYQWGQWTRHDLFTYRPAMARLCHDLSQLYPTARVLFLINDNLRDDIVESTHTVAAYYGMECLDLHDIDKQSGHPSQKGMTAIADQLCSYLQATPAPASSQQ